jgi:hypothetical protein
MDKEIEKKHKEIIRLQEMPRKAKKEWNYGIWQKYRNKRKEWNNERIW